MAVASTVSGWEVGCRAGRPIGNAMKSGAYIAREAGSRLLPACALKFFAGLLTIWLENECRIAMERALAVDRGVGSKTNSVVLLKIR